MPPAALCDEPIVYQGKAATNLSIREKPDSGSERLAYFETGETVSVISYDLEWLKVVKNGVVGYAMRKYVDVDKKLDPSAPTYGSLQNKHVAVVINDAPMFSQPNTNSANLMNVKRGARLAIAAIKDGWASVLFNRQFGYIHASNLAELEPIAPNPLTAAAGSIISAFETSYTLSDAPLILGRIENIRVACAYMNGAVVRPNERKSFNSWIGPYTRERGYMEAPVLINGTTVPGSGGGTCQVSTTFYNALILLPGITIQARRAHGAQGAAYAPYGVDSAVGNAQLDLAFRNDYDFPIVIDTYAVEGILYIALYKEFKP
jgi:hypothetical protein